MDVPIDMKKLADSLDGELANLPSSSKECSIYRVPETKRCLNPSHYTPQMVSIGPFHHGKPALKAMEEHKRRYLKSFLQRTEADTMARLLTHIKKKEAELRGCYAETIHNLEGDEFITMVLVDAVFLIELFLRANDSNLITDDDRIFGKSRLLEHLTRDLSLVENQLPLFILKGLYDVAKTATDDEHIYNKISFLKITCFFVRGTMSAHLPEAEENLLENHFSEAKHFLHLIILCLQPAQQRVKILLKDPNVPSVKELHQAGVKFRKPAAGPTKNLLDITFDGRIMEIPFLTLYDMTECLFRNLLAFERMHGCPTYFNDYIIMMGCLVNSPKDAELLIRNEVIGLGDTETLPALFRNNLDTECLMSNSDFQYAGVVAKLNDYRKSPWHEWKATLKQKYFNTPWASISVIAAVILLLLTATQTIASLIAL